jgi:hypothetical protein
MISSAYSNAVAEIIHQSSFQIQPGTYIYAKVNAVANDSDHFLVTKDLDEITLVTLAEKLDSLDLIERNKDDYRLISLNVSIPFYSVGFLATVSDAFADRGMNILIVSTYSKDYILVRADLERAAEDILLKLGFTPALH